MDERGPLTLMERLRFLAQEPWLFFNDYEYWWMVDISRFCNNVLETGVFRPNSVPFTVLLSIARYCVDQGMALNDQMDAHLKESKRWRR